MFVPLLIASFALNSPPSSPATQSVEPKSTISAVQAAILQGDGARARDLLASLPTDLPDAKDRDFRACSLARLDGPTSAVDGRTPAFTQRLLAIYHRYWRDSVMMPVDRDAAQDRFHNALADLLEMPRSTALDTITDRTKARIEEAGFHAITGKTGLLHDLIMWSKQADRLEVVPLPDGPIKTRVSNGVQKGPPIGVEE
ncbi:hypothetical protein, partial [Sphingobium yanoikuyae]|uniref:hypothetical protein n=1 Tax=Sphingobium yanoikuyae TaxID=13690 RepID=UPI000B1545F9